MTSHEVNPIIKWKGRTITQVSSSIVRNAVTQVQNLNVKLLFKALPLKIYRRELASKVLRQCDQKVSLKITQFDMPGGTSNTIKSINTGIICTNDINYENNSCQHPPNPIS